MSAWERRRARRAEEKRRKAYDRLHGRGAVSSSRRRSGSGEEIGELIVDLLLLVPRGVLWVFSKIFSAFVD